nr:nucleoside triphosphate pyrophosphohydrolase family protein [Microbulbifer elongatus]
MLELSGAIPLRDYERVISETDRFSKDDITPILLGLYGEVGSIMSASKKYHREKKAYLGYKESVEEEFGDAFWYFSALCRRYGLKLADIFEVATQKSNIKIVSANNHESAPVPFVVGSDAMGSLDSSLLDLGCLTAKLLKLDRTSSNVRDSLVDFAEVYLRALKSMKLSFAHVLKGNLRKAFGRFSEPDLSSLPDFDLGFPEEEQLPRNFEIEISQRANGQSYLRWNGVFIGSPLTDNMKSPDGYRFHDVFHLAYAAVLHWSPTIRALIKHKRKSDPIFDEAQDSGRAIVVEEGLTAWIYSYSKALDHFDGHDRVSFDVLKTIQKFVQGYEVEQCPLKLWEDAILKGYSVFREVKKNNGGFVIGDRENRTLRYRALGVGK